MVALPVISFSIPAVVGKGRPRFTKDGRVYTPKQTHDAERAIANAYKDASAYEHASAVLAAPKDERVNVTIAIQKPLPKSAKVESDYFLVKPDIDNVGKLVLDGLNGVAYADDAQVTKLTIVKRPRFKGIEAQTSVTVSWGPELTFLGE